MTRVSFIQPSPSSTALVTLSVTAKGAAFLAAVKEINRLASHLGDSSPVYRMKGVKKGEVEASKNFVIDLGRVFKFIVPNLRNVNFYEAEAFVRLALQEMIKNKERATAETACRKAEADSSYLEGKDTTELALTEASSQSSNVEEKPLDFNTTSFLCMATPLTSKYHEENEF